MLSRLEINQDIPFIKGLSVKGIAAFDFKPNTQKRWSLPMKLYNAVKDADTVRYDQISGSGSPSLYDFKSIERNLVLEAHAIYNRTFGKHNLGALLLYSQQSWNYDNTSASRSGFLSSQLDIINTGGTANQQTGGTSNQYRRQSTVGRLNYSFDQRYLMEFDFRYDGSDLFAQGKRFGFFPAMSLGWVLSREAFMEQIDAIEFFKIRASYGELGNDQIGQYQYKDLYAFGTGVPLGDPSVYQNNIYLSRLANTDVTWEKSKKLNIGFESRIFKNFSLEADYFEEKRDDILGQRGATVPATLGASSILPFENFQKVNNKGFEVVAGFQKQLGKDLSFQTRFSVTHARNKVVDIGESSSVPERIRQAGRPLYSIYGYKALGIFQSQEEINKVYGNNYPDLKPGDVHYADLNGDSRIDGNDITYIGSTNLPVNIYGLQTSATYKGIDVAMFWQAGTGNQQYFNNWMAKPFNQAGNALVAHEDYWRPDNTDARYPRILTSSSWNYDAVSTFWLYDTKYLRLKNLAIGYTLPKKWIKAIKSQNVRINFNASNLLTFSPYKEVDPENTNSNGHYYPQQVVYNFGASIGF